MLQPMVVRSSSWMCARRMLAPAGHGDHLLEQVGDGDRFRALRQGPPVRWRYRSVLPQPRPGPTLICPAHKDEKTPRYFPNWLRQRVERSWASSRMPAASSTRQVAYLCARGSQASPYWETGAPATRAQTPARCRDSRSARVPGWHCGTSWASHSAWTIDVACARWSVAQPGSPLADDEPTDDGSGGARHKEQSGLLTCRTIANTGTSLYRNSRYTT